MLHVEIRHPNGETVPLSQTSLRAYRDVLSTLAVESEEAVIAFFDRRPWPVHDVHFDAMARLLTLHFFDPEAVAAASEAWVAARATEAPARKRRKVAR